MRKQLTVVLGLAVLSTPAFATKARLQALGEDIYGSFYVNDNRNVFLNPAQVINHKDLVTFEWGQNGATDSVTTPKAEGGIYKAGGNLVYGVHLGAANNFANLFRSNTGLVNNGEENNIDLFVGGDTGLKWGVNVGYANTEKDETAADAEAKSLRTRLGVIMGDTQVYGNINIVNEAEGVNAGAQSVEFEGKLGFGVGAIQAWNGTSLFVDFKKLDAEGEVAGAGSEDMSLQQIQAGIARVTVLNDKTNLFTRASFVQTKAENDLTGGAFAAVPGCNRFNPLACAEYDSMQVPVVLGLEAEATEWLTLRGSITQVVWGSEEDATNERGIRNSTGVNAGATLKFGELSVDGMIGNTAGAAPTSTDTSGGSGTLRTDTLLTRVGVNYRF